MLLSIYTVILGYLITSNGYVLTSSTHPLSEEIARQVYIYFFKLIFIVVDQNESSEKCSQSLLSVL